MSKQGDLMSQSNLAPTPSTAETSSQISENIVNDNLIFGDEIDIEINENTNNENSVETLTVGGKKRSPIWEHFEEAQKNGVCKAICKYCKKEFSCGSGTTHLARHLKLSCKKRPNQDIKQLFITRASKEAGSDIKTFKFDALVSRKDLAKLVVCAELSFKFVEHPIFLDFVRRLQPLFQIPGRLTIRKECVALYEEVDDIRYFLHRIYVEYEMTNKKASEATLTCETSSGDSNSSSLGKRKIDMDYYKFWSQNLSSRHKKNELESYLGEDVLPPDEEFDILAWWKNKANEYPILSKMARDFLAIPVSTVSSESAFSTSGRVIDSKRSRLNPSTVEALICTQDWIRGDNDIQGGDDACFADECLIIPE